MDGDGSQHCRDGEQRLLGQLAETLRELGAMGCSQQRRPSTADTTRHRAEACDRGPCVVIITAGDTERGTPPPPAKETTRRERSSTAEEGGIIVGSTDGGSKKNECEQRALRLLRELCVVHSDRVTAWRQAAAASAAGGPACTSALCPPEGHHQQEEQNVTEIESACCSDPFARTFLGVLGDIGSIVDRLNHIRTKLDGAMSMPHTEEEAGAGRVDRTCTTEEVLTTEESSSPDATTAEQRTPHSPSDHLGSVVVSGRERRGGGGDGGDDVESLHAKPAALPLSQRSLDEEGVSNSSSSGRSERSDNAKEEVRPVCDLEQRPLNSPEAVVAAVFPQETDEDEGSSGWVTVGLPGRLEGGRADLPDACYVTAPGRVASAMSCDVVDDALSSAMVAASSEELVSRVLRVRVNPGADGAAPAPLRFFRFPITVAVPFQARYRGNYRDVVVKVVDGERRASCIAPVSTEGTYGGHRGSFAEVRVYTLGVFAVVSCLRRENYTIPRKGLSLKLPMDPRICLDYLPGSFTAPVVAQSMIQPVDAALLSSIRSRSDAYHSVVSTSPLLYLTHPSSRALRRALTLTLPCPPNPDRKKGAGHGEEESEQHIARPLSAAAPPRDTPSSLRLRALSASVKTRRETANELLLLLARKDEQWNVLEKVAVRNVQNGLVSFELAESYARLLVVRLHSSVRASHLISLVEELEESIWRHAVAIVLHRQLKDPHDVLVSALPSRDLSWELSKLGARGYVQGPPGPSPEIPMCEGDQLLIRFSGNITSTGTQRSQNGGAYERITFHSQHKSHLLLRLTEVDPFGNYSSSHYKGTAMFYKIARDQLLWRGDGTVPSNISHLGEPVCKLSLTLPKKERTINRPISTKVRVYDDTEPLSDAVLSWLSEELSEEEVALLVLALRLCRSATQLVRLRAGDRLSAQAFHLLALWRRGAPTAQHPARASRLARCLERSGRPDLARELLLRSGGK